MRIAIVYTSITGNTEELALLLCEQFKKNVDDIFLYRIEQFPLHTLENFDAIVIGTYTWGNGDIPIEMEQIFQAIAKRERKNLVTGIFGTGDRFYPYFCGAVDRFKDVLNNSTDLAVTLKVELLPQELDLNRCMKFVNIISERVQMKHQLNVYS
ncbi:flavodoxin domain-containing protein [Bacillus sp. FJAT-49705]|uniref:Flavodoxin domain-containing protein n=1 Tax=Cytobacillus citreus TaxID=2833586 RepID=A0ABS5NSN1_9BACI|nr:flavodoxin domain-containing protein [Cytobacillus citreus]MBS4190832.1 flavodoxin domain-containing protein [Cytobacillus citreus]